MNQLVNELNNLGLHSIITTKVDMGDFTSFKAGGRADLLATPKDENQLMVLMQLLKTHKIPFVVMGKGTNLLVRDAGYHGMIIRLEEGFSQIDIEDTTLTAGAGAALSVVARVAMELGLTGLEFGAGIPGSLGGGVFMNAGAYGGELKDVVREVRVLSDDGGAIRTISREELAYGYRHSSLMNSGDLVLSATLTLAKGDKQVILAKMKEYNDSRNQKQPMEFPSAGSFFKRPEGHFAGKLIQDAGLKGLTIGGAQVSTKHSGFIVNRGGATATDIIQLMHVVQASVLDQFGVLLEPEVRIVGEAL